MFAVLHLRELLVYGCLVSWQAQGRRIELQLARVGAGLASAYVPCVCQRDT